MSKRHRTGIDRDRGQLVLISAVIIAVSFVPITVAYLQLGYHADIEARADTTAADTFATTRQLLQRTVHDGVTNDNSSYNDTVTAVRSRLRPHISTIERESATTATAQQVHYNNTTALLWASMHCPNGTGLRFGPCTADRGVVVQERAGETHVVAVAFDVTLTTERARLEATVVVKPVARIRSAHAARTDARRGTFHRTRSIRSQRARTVPTLLPR